MLSDNVNEFIPAGGYLNWLDRIADIPLPKISVTLWIAGLLRIASIALLHKYLHPDTWEFAPLARSLAAGLGYSDLAKDGARVPSIYMPPAYSYFLAAFFRVAGEKPATYLAIEIVQALCGILSVYMVYRLGDLLAGRRSGLAAALIVAIFPTQVYMCNEFHSINIYIVLGLATVYFLTRYSFFDHSMANIVQAGICMGILMLFRGEAPALALLYALILLLLGHRRAFLPTLVFLIIAFACLAPWAARNYLIFHRLIPVCASSGTNLWVGNNPLATGSQHSVVNYPYPPEVVNAVYTNHTALHSVQLDDALKEVALNYIRSHPKHEVELALRKLFIFFVFDPAHPKGRNPVYWAPSLLVSIIAVCGAWRRGWALLTTSDLFVVGSIIFAVAICTLVFTLPRYKMVVDPFFFVLASYVFTAKKSIVSSPKLLHSAHAGT